MARALDFDAFFVEFGQWDLLDDLVLVAVVGGRHDDLVVEEVVAFASSCAVGSIVELSIIRNENLEVLRKSGLNLVKVII